MEKKYTIEEIKANPKLIIFINSLEEYEKLSEKFELCGYNGNYCYHPTERNYSYTSSLTDTGAYKRDCTIIQFPQIDFQEQSVDLISNFVLW